MSYAKLDDNFPDHPKVIELSDSAFRLAVTAICYSARILTDGRLTPQSLRRFEARAKDVTALVDARLWEVDGKEYVIHDYLEYNLSKEEVLAERERVSKQRREAGVASGKARRERNANGPFVPRSNEKATTPAEPSPLLSVRDSLRSSLSARELCEEWLSAMPQKFQRDLTTRDDMALLAEDYVNSPTEVREAIQGIKRDGDIPFPGSIRKRLKPAVVEAPRNLRPGPKVTHATP